MSEARGDSSEDYFNDLSRQPANTADEPNEHLGSDNEPPKLKRTTACVICRKRKLKCDGKRPACSTCSRLQHDCSYDEVRKKSGPKRGYVKLLEARLAQVETLLKTQSDQPTASSAKEHGNTANGPNSDKVPDAGGAADLTSKMSTQQTPPFKTMLASDVTGSIGTNTEDTYPWEMISMGLEEPLPIQPVVDELNELFFEKVHISIPMMHRSRYFAAMHLAPHTRPPVCLRYAMWCNAAVVTDKYNGLQDHFYQRARKYVQKDEMKGHGEGMLTVAHVQTWILLATYEFKHMLFPRAWMSSGRASRMAQMLGLSRLDNPALDVKQCLPPARDWTEIEERRRTFWMTFCVDRYSSIGTGWPMSIEELDIRTNLPASQEAFDYNKPEKTGQLASALEPSGLTSLSTFGGIVLTACLFGRNLTHLHRPSSDGRDYDMNGEFWTRHLRLDSILLNTSLSLPDHLRLPAAMNNPNVVFMNMNIHTSTICLHQAAIFKAELHKDRISDRVAAESKVRCIAAAAETASIMRIISHLDLTGMNPFISFCLYVAARVFIQYLRSRPGDHQVGTSLRFLLSAMHAIKRKNPLTESFLVQLDVDLEGAGLNSLRMEKAKIHNPASLRERTGVPHFGKHNSRVPTYGDQGLARYNSPNQNIVDAGNIATDFDTGTNSSGSINCSAAHLELPNRQRTHGTFISEIMDTSPDGSGDRQGSGSSTQNVVSSHTSSTAYSPQQQQQADPTQFTAMFDTGNEPAFPSEFDIPSTARSGAHQQTGFGSNQNWSSEAQGTSVPSGILDGSGFSTLAGGELGDVMSGMSDAEWNNVLNSMSGWDTGLDQHSMNVL